MPLTIAGHISPPKIAAAMIGLAMKNQPSLFLL